MTQPQGLRYDTMRDRLVANTAEPETACGCWPWTGSKKSRYGYGRLNIYVPGLRTNTAVTAHVLAFVLLEADHMTTDELYLAYLEMRCSGLELDHTCENTACINPDHLDPTTPSINCQRKYRR